MKWRKGLQVLFQNNYWKKQMTDFTPRKTKNRKKNHTNLVNGRKAALENTLKSHSYNNKYFDRNKKSCKPKIGDWNWMN